MNPFSSTYPHCKSATLAAQYNCEAERKSARMKSLAAIVAFMMLLFAGALNASASEATSASEANGSETQGVDHLSSGLLSGIHTPVIVTAADLMTKVYGAIEISDSKEETIAHASKQFNMIPEADNNDLWMDSDRGYAVCYSGMSPEVSAVAQYDDNKLRSFGYFFIFPYTSGCREEANQNQCSFCSCLLQEMYDMGSITGVPVDDEMDTTPDPLFEALGSYDGNHINVTLRELTQPDDSGRFLLVLEVTPNVYNLYDDVMAAR